MNNKALVQQLKKSNAKQQLSLYMSKLSNNDVAKLIYKTSDPFLYSKEWRDLRKKAIEMYGTVCVKCGAQSTKKLPINIDHIKPRKYFPHLALEITNLQPLCQPCNKRKGNNIY